ncbi:MAG TPA: hypothetical protein ENG87_02275 [Candidatus Pacearchaeota archaeon]|nr:hypothetical protein BMS3Abin17_00369 [archaeon BMS3Abin17]HDK42181.1 hypothetical protein [Candidatus Pacearchaeota archaeon]HDZ60236.1 hypothetical protein [Candidatus Pacearchaeota archaeon]
MKANYYYKKRRNRKAKYILIIVVVLIGLVWAYDSGYIEIPKTQTTALEKYKCPSDIIPTFLSTEDYDSWDGTGLYWYDGTPMSKYREYTHTPALDLCRKGKFEGENINYFYCNNLIYDKSETEISEEGKIGKTITTRYVINLEVKKYKDMEKDAGIYGIQKWVEYQVTNSLCFPVEEIPKSRDMLEEFQNWVIKEEVWKY